MIHGTITIQGRAMAVRAPEEDYGQVQVRDRRGRWRWPGMRACWILQDIIEDARHCDGAWAASQGYTFTEDAS